MKRHSPFLSSLLLSLCLTAGIANAKAEPRPLVEVGPYAVTAHDLESAVSASPFATQFVAMDRDQQAALRGDLLKRLVISRLFRLEAERLGLDRTPEFRRELERFRLGLLYRHYMDRLRAQIAIPDEALARMRADTEGDPDALEAMKSAYVAERYRTLRLLTVQRLRDARHLVVHDERIGPKADADTVVMEGDGLRITYGDLLAGASPSGDPDTARLKERLFRLGELRLVAEAAAAEGVSVDARLENYRNERLPALLLEKMEAGWIPDEQALRDHFAAHPEIAHVAERRHIGMLVTATYAQAQALRRRILGGESLFALAGRYSVDPYGRAHNGDMGWVREGTGMPEIEQAIADLQDDQISEIVKTPRGFHIVTVIERKPGEDRPFAGVRDKVRQSLLSEHLNRYVGELERRYEISWNLIQPTSPAGTGETP